MRLAVALTVLAACAGQLPVHQPAVTVMTPPPTVAVVVVPVPIPIVAPPVIILPPPPAAPPPPAPPPPAPPPPPLPPPSEPSLPAAQVDEPPGFEPYDIATILATETRLRDQSCACAARHDDACLARARQETMKWVQASNARYTVQTHDTTATTEQWDTVLRLQRERNRCELPPG